MKLDKVVTVFLACVWLSGVNGHPSVNVSEEESLRYRNKAARLASLVDGSRVPGEIISLVTCSSSSRYVKEIRRDDKARISKRKAVSLARRYLKINDTKEFEIGIKDALITSETFNAYKKLDKGIERSAWVVTFAVPRAVGASRTVYVDKKTGEILGGFSSK